MAFARKGKKRNRGLTKGLQIAKLAVNPAAINQLIVCATLDNLAFLQHNDFVCMFNG